MSDSELQPENAELPIFLTLSDINTLARELQPKNAEVPILETLFGIITFYSQFSLSPKAKYNIDVCLGTACFVLGAQDVLDRILAKLGVKVGEMTKDGKWIVTSCRCLGCCGLAPAVTINGEVYGKLKPEDVDKLIDSFAD